MNVTGVDASDRVPVPLLRAARTDHGGEDEPQTEACALQQSENVAIAMSNSNGNSGVDKEAKNSLHDAKS